MKQAFSFVLIFVLAFAYAIGMALLVQNDLIPFWGAMGFTAVLWIAIIVLIIPKKNTQ
ncbi:hypothetical protein RIF23_18495 [Lipingzhangella sp. LS1_29]|uniref:Uncharacterized protein n=1 Tax=Lipingzhangella rawalii TaxID=2055835 RepID=A0ABU2HAK9_9ACTN|nr:hypothetical protein [Lipingzhangella rawalii]MDS1272283.1 hypothetical protein [Lipingzhangella rawalii]